MSDQLPDVVIAMIEAALPGVPIGDTVSPAAPRYVRFNGDPGERWAEDVAHTSDLVRYRFRVTYVADAEPYGRKGVEWLIDRVRPALVDVVPQVTGYVFGPIELEPGAGQPIQIDDSAVTDVLFGSDGFVVMGARA
ncbi:MAG: hypothetical protein ACTHQ3_15790 [Motilibacteraceae bacterium]